MITPLIWPFTIIPNLPENLMDIIDSPLPMLIGMLGDEKLAEKIQKIRGGENNIILTKNNNVKYYKEEKVPFAKELLFNLKHSLEQNFNELKLYKNKKKDDSNFKLVNEKIYKNINGAIKKNFCTKIDFICEKYKHLFKKGNLISTNEELTYDELGIRQNIKEQFEITYSDMGKNVDFYRIFPHTQIFSSYLDIYITKINKV